MRLLAGAEAQSAWQMVSEAVNEARLASCGRSRCGSVIITAAGGVIGHGFNSPPADRPDQRRCERKFELAPGFKSDRTCCIHAEWRAILDALRQYPDQIGGGRIYFIRLDAQGAPEPAGQPYCTICSKLALDVGLAEFVLWHAKGITVYDTAEYNDLSYAYGN